MLPALVLLRRRVRIKIWEGNHHPFKTTTGRIPSETPSRSPCRQRVGQFSADATTLHGDNVTYQAGDQKSQSHHPQ